MKAVGIIDYLPIDDAKSFVDFTTDKPAPTGQELLVSVKAIAINPWDASGVVEAVGADVTLFKPGDEVFYAGDITKPGCNAEYQLIDQRIVGKKPSTISFTQAAALPLTSITAYECFFDRLNIDRNGANAGESLLIIGGAGGVGSVGIQIAKQAKLNVIATASRPETQAWVKALGADHVVDHHGDMVAQVTQLGLETVDHIAVFNDMSHWDAAVELIRPQGGIVSIDNTNSPMPMEGMKAKAASLHWEFMFARPMYETPDMIKQHELLNWISELVDAGSIQSTITQTLSPINAETLREAHRLIETGQSKGKLVLEGFA